MFVCDYLRVDCIHRRHTLVYVPNSGRMYSFGTGANGQLGIKSPDAKPLPTCVVGPFVAFDKASGTSNGSSYVVRGISAGGDICFVWASPEQVLNILVESESVASILLKFSKNTCNNYFFLV